MTELQSPVQYWGGKAKAAPLVWERFGKVDTYLEPFFGGGSVLIKSPYGPARREVVYDANSLVCNLFRALQHDPDTVAWWADFPSNHTEFAARRKEIQRRYEGLTDRLLDITYYDAQLAGIYCWYINLDIGIGSALLTDQSDGVGAAPGLSASGGSWSHRQKLPARFQSLCRRLADVQVLCKPWDGQFTPSLLDGNPCGVFLDPPYATPTRAKLYSVNDMTVAQDVQRWAVEQGSRLNMRIAVCGYGDDYDPWPEGWSAVVWKEGAGTSGHGKGMSVTGHERQETIWFSPHCLPGVVQAGLI